MLSIIAPQTSVQKPKSDLVTQSELRTAGFISDSFALFGEDYLIFNIHRDAALWVLYPDCIAVVEYANRRVLYSVQTRKEKQ